MLKLETYFLKIVADSMAYIEIGDRFWVNAFWYRNASKSIWQSKSSFISNIQKNSIELLNILNYYTKTQLAPTLFEAVQVKGFTKKRVRKVQSD